MELMYDSVVQVAANFIFQKIWPLKKKSKEKRTVLRRHTGRRWAAAVWHARERENNMWGHKKRPKDAIKMIIFCSSATVCLPPCRCHLKIMFLFMNCPIELQKKGDQHCYLDLELEIDLDSLLRAY